MAKRTVSRGPATGADAAPAPAAAPAPDATLVAAQREADAMLPGTPPIAPPVVHEWKNDDSPFDGMRSSLHDVLAAGDAASAGDTTDGTAAAGDQAATDGTAAAAPAEGQAPAAGEKPPEQAAAEPGKPVYLTAEQRKAVQAKLDAERQRLGVEGQLHTLQTENANLKQTIARAKAGDLDAALELAGISRDAAFERLMYGGAGAGAAPAQDGAAAAPAAPDATVAALKAEVEALKRGQTERTKAEEHARAQALQQRTIAVIDGMVQAQAAEFPMVAALGLAADVLTEAETLWNEAVRPGTPGAEQRAASLNSNEVAQVAAHRVEERERARRPKVFAALTAGAAAAPAAGGPGSQAAAKPAPTVGARAGAPTTEPQLDVPLDDPSRHEKIRAMFFSRSRQ